MKVNFLEGGLARSYSRRACDVGDTVLNIFGKYNWPQDLSLEMELLDHRVCTFIT